MNRRTSALADTQWEEIALLFSGLREYRWPKRELMDAVLYFVKTGCQWRNLPHDFPPYSTVHSFYRGARLSGLWDKTLEHLIVKKNSVLRATVVFSCLILIKSLAWALAFLRKPSRTNGKNFLGAG
ncbi:MAG: transposase [Syntrophomonadaceae bacterium]|nr:transposase [Syntrophomonadaceae bacterium]